MFCGAKDRLFACRLDKRNQSKIVYKMEKKYRTN